MLHTQLKSNEQYTDHQGRILVAGDVYSSQDAGEKYYHVFFYVPELYRFVWLAWENYQLFSRLPQPERFPYIEQHWQNHFVELDRVFRFSVDSDYTYEGNLFTAPEKFNLITA